MAYHGQSASEEKAFGLPAYKPGSNGVQDLIEIEVPSTIEEQWNSKINRRHGS